MDNYLEKICINLGLKLVFTNNKVTVLSAEAKDGMTIIRAHKLLKSCPPETAQAVIDYFTNAKKRETSEEIIRDYLISQGLSDNLKIKPGDISIVKEMEKNLPVETKESDGSMSLLGEYNISSMTIKNFWGDKLTQSKDHLLSPDSDDVLELDIVVKQEED